MPVARRARTQVGAAGLARAPGNLAPRLALWRALGRFNHRSGCSRVSKQLWLSYIPVPSAHSQSSEATLEDTNPLPGLPGTILDTDGEQDVSRVGSVSGEGAFETRRRPDNPREGRKRGISSYLSRFNWKCLSQASRRGPPRDHYLPASITCR